MGYAKVVYEDEPLIDLTADTVNSTSVLSGKTFHDYKGDVITGSMTDRGSGSSSISRKAQTVYLNEGYYNGAGSVAIDSAEQAKIIAENIKKDVTILGVTGTHEGGSGTYEEEDLSTGGFWAKINYIESYPEAPGVSERKLFVPYLESVSGKHCTVYAKTLGGEWVTQAWNDTIANQYITDNTLNEEFHYKINLKIVPDAGYKIDPTNIPLYSEYTGGNYGSIFAGVYSGYKTDTTGSCTAWANIIDIDSNGNGYAAVCLTNETTATGNSVDIYCKAIPI